MLGTVLTPHAHSNWMLIVLIGVDRRRRCRHGGPRVLMSAVGRPCRRNCAIRERHRQRRRSFGQFAVVPFAQAPTGVLGWVGALSVVGVMALAAAPLAWLLRGKARGGGGRQHAAPEKSIGPRCRDAMRDPSFVYLTTGFFVCGFHVAFIATHLPGVVASCQLPPEVAAWSLSLIGLFNIAGSFTAGWAIGRWRMKSVLSLLYAARGLAVIAFLAAPKTTTTFIVFSVAIGFTYLATVPPTVGLVVKLTACASSPPSSASSCCRTRSAASSAPGSAGKMFEATGGYEWMWYVDVMLAFAAALIHLPISEAPRFRSARLRRERRRARASAAQPGRQVEEIACGHVEDRVGPGFLPAVQAILERPRHVGGVETGALSRLRDRADAPPPSSPRPAPKPSRRARPGTPRGRAYSGRRAPRRARNPRAGQAFLAMSTSKRDVAVRQRREDVAAAQAIQPRHRVRPRRQAMPGVVQMLDSSSVSPPSPKGFSRSLRIMR